MPETGIPTIPFHPARVLNWEKGFVVIGVDGEFLSLDSELNPVGDVKRPFPSPIRHAVIVDDRLVVSWIEHELLVGRLSAFELGKQFEDGPERAEIRLSNSLLDAPHPAGVMWSHALNSEPLAMSGNNELFCLILWKKGVYGFTNQDTELWRMPEPTWSNMKHLPRAEDVVDCSIDGELLSVWSRGGGYTLYSTLNGEIVKSDIVDYEGIVDSVFSHKENYLLCYEDGNVIWYRDEGIVKQTILKGVVQHAEWNSNSDGWAISGWREECLLTESDFQRVQLSEIPVQRVHSKHGCHLLLNNGVYIKSTYQ